MSLPELPPNATGKQRAQWEILKLDQKEAWPDLLSKDVPEPITSWVRSAIEKHPPDEVREALGMRAPGDPRWKKIMTAIRGGTRVDAVAIFHSWLARNQDLGNRISEFLRRQLEQQQPFSKQASDAMRLLLDLQKNTVSVGKELGVFTDSRDQGGQGGGTTIIVQTHVPSPSREVIIEHQKAEQEKSRRLIEQHRIPSPEDVREVDVRQQEPGGPSS